MKKAVLTFAGLVAGLAFAVEVPSVQVITFSTQGPDFYADGATKVSDGECYALVWAKDGSFDGITAEGKAKNGTDEQVVYIGALAKDGRCGEVTFQIADAAFQDGAFELWVLDTRVFADGKVVQLGKKGGEVTVSYAAKATASISCGTVAEPKRAEGIAGGAVAAVPSVDPSEIPAPKFKGLSFDTDGAGKEVVVLEIEKSVRGVNYTVEGDATPSFENAVEGKITTGTGDTIKVIVPKTGNVGFFKGKVK